ncbi:MAG: 2-amino-4-hydroxy-6-hydroxymethyldihydropteridine diphosphokinase [Tannerella sp.]|nr:2-amino-4-hydroxy-6-hydroxymethyldihydropteridine diphosphokinase [Tannerella sp.]
MEKPAHCYLSLGSNLGNRKENIVGAIVRISEKAGRIVALSGYYETEPWGFESESKFLNVAVEIVTNLPPADLLRTTQEIERETGRKEKSVDGVYKDRIIDIDILFYDNLILNTNDLKIPHPLLHERPFVLQPLAEIAPDFVHPQLNRKMKDFTSPPAVLTVLP